MLNNSAKCSYVRELGRPFRGAFYDALSEDALMKSSLETKTIPLPSAAKTTFFMAVSPDGQSIASAHGDHSIYVSNILDGKVVHHLTGHPRSPWTLAFHPYRSDLLASGCLGGEVRVWDLKSGCSEKLRLNNDNPENSTPGTSSGGDNTVATIAIASVAFHPDERLLVVAAADRLIFWDWSNKDPRAECRTATPRERVRFVKFDRTGVLYTGITNSPNLVATETEIPRPVMASTPPEVVPYRCRELLTSRNEILRMRAELSRRHEQLLQRYNDLLRRYEELRASYPDYPGLTRLPPGPILPPPPSPPPTPRWLYEEEQAPQQFVSLMEENRRLATDGGDTTSNATANGSGSTEQRMTSIRLPFHPPVVNLSPSRTVAIRRPDGSTTYHYSYPYSPPRRQDQNRRSIDSISGQESSSGQSSENTVLTKRRRLNFDSPGESSYVAASSPVERPTSSEPHDDLNRTLPLPNEEFVINSQAASAIAAVPSLAGHVAISNTTPQVNTSQRRERPNIVLFVPRESSRLSSAANSMAEEQRSPSEIYVTRNMVLNSGRAFLAGSPPRFEQIPSNRLTPFLRRQQRQMADSQGPDRIQFTGIRRIGAGMSSMPSPRSGGGASQNRNNGNDEELEYPYDLNRAVNRAIAGAFVGSGDAALANNILDMTCRVQRWSTTIGAGKYPDLTQAYGNVIISKCKLHNDGSVCINDSGTLLAAFVENNSPDRSLWAHTTLKIVSLRPDDRGTVLYEKTFGPNAISVSFSPADGRHVLIGLASRRYLRLRHSPQTCAMIFSLRDEQRNNGHDGKRPVGELKLVMNVEHDQRQNATLFGGGGLVVDEGSSLLTFGLRVDSANCATWLPTPGQGLCYGTNRGQIFVLIPKRGEPDQLDEGQGSTVPGGSFQRQSARWNVFEEPHGRGPGDVELLSGNGNLML